MADILVVKMNQSTNKGHSGRRMETVLGREGGIYKIDLVVGEKPRRNGERGHRSSRQS